MCMGMSFHAYFLVILLYHLTATLHFLWHTLHISFHISPVAYAVEPRYSSGNAPEHIGSSFARYSHGHSQSGSDANGH